MFLQSLRPLTRSIVMTRSTTLVASTSITSTRFSSHDSHSHDAHASEESYPAETFGSPVWRNSILAALALALFFRLNPIPTTSPPWSSSTSSSVEEETPFITKYIAYHMPAIGLWKKRNEDHLDMAKLAADDKLLFQEAERPKVRRMRYLGTFDQASPNGIPVGSQADLTGLRIKSEKEDFAKIGGDSEEEEE